MLKISKVPPGALAAVVCLSALVAGTLGSKGLVSLGGDSPREPQQLQRWLPGARQLASEVFERLPLSFEPNAGQASPEVKFVSRAKGCALLLTSPGPLLKLRPGGDAANPDAPGDVCVRMSGTRSGVVPEGLEALPGKTNYIVGNNPSRWRTGIPNFAKVLYRGLYPGVDMVIYGQHGSFEYDFVVAPGADARAIKFHVEGPRRIQIDSSGDLAINTGAGEVRIHKPVAYQQVAKFKKEIPARYSIREHDIEIELNEYDRTRPLVIDPVLSYSRYLGGSGNDSGRGIAVDAQGNAYIAGSTSSSDFPGSVPADRFGGDAFVTKLDPSGALLFSTIIGGRNSDGATAVAVDALGSVYITGNTLSEDFPVAGAIQSLCPPNVNGVCNGAFVTKLNSAGSGIAYSTFLPGSGTTFSFGIAVDSAGNAYVTGSTTAAAFPIVNAAQPVYGGGPQSADGDAFIVKLNPAGTAFVYSTYLGGFGTDRAQAIAVNAAGDAYVAGFSRSGNFPVAGAFQPLARRAAYKTTDAGAEWRPSDNLPASDVTAFAVDPQIPSTVYAGTDGSGLFKSTDGGATWRQTLNAAQSATRVNAIAIDPSNRLVLYAACRLGVLRSTDGGVSWSPGGVVIDGFDVRVLLNVAAIAVDPSGSGTVFATTNSADPTGAVRSTNGGVTWIRLGRRGAGSGATIAVHPMNPAIVFAGDSKSTDGGVTWRDTFNFGEGLSVVINPLSPSTLYIGASGGVFKSTDEGNTWLLASPPSMIRSARVLAIDPKSPSTLYAGSLGSVFKTTDAGATWAAMNNGFPIVVVNALGVDPQTPATIYLGSSIRHDAFVTRLNAAGSALTYSTLLGGTQDDLAVGLAVDNVGNAVVTGLTVSSDFPTVHALQPAFAGGSDVFITRHNSTGALVYSTYLGGSGSDEGLAVAADSSGNAYVVGHTQSTDFPLVNPVQPNFGGGDFQGGDAFALKLNAAGSLSYSTYLGGSGADRANAVAVDLNGTAFVAGDTVSTNLPVTGNSPTHNSGLQDIFAVKLSQFGDPVPSLSISLNANTANVETGGNIVYTITIANIGDASAQSLAVADNLPSSLSFLSCSTSPGGVCGGTGNARTATFSALVPGGSATVSITAQANCLAPTAPILNEATVGAAGISSISAQAIVAATNPPPTLTCPSGSVVQATSGAGAVVNFSTPAGSDNCPGTAVVCSPPSGANFPVGSTTVSCTATDSGGATASCGFNVTVTNSNVPQIDSAAVVGKNLIITGRGFDLGARILMDGVERKSRNDPDNPSTVLIGKKVGKLIARGQTVGLQVRNPGGVTSVVFVFRRPD